MHSGKKRRRDSQEDAAQRTTRRRVATPVIIAPSTPTKAVQQFKKLTSHFQSILDNKNGRLYLVLDWGTSKFGVTYATDGSGSAEPLDVNVHHLSLENGSNLKPALLGFSKVKFKKPSSDQQVYLVVHGEEVRERCLRGNILPNNVFRNLKQSEPFINLDELKSSKRRTYLRKIQDKHAALLARLRGSIIVIDHKPTGTKQNITIESMRDVVCLQMRILRLEITAALARVSNASVEMVEEMLSGNISRPFGGKIQLGVSAPELWDRQRLVLYELLIDAGFSPQLEILSEAKCATAAVLRKRCDTELGRNWAFSPDKIKNLAKKIIMVVDRGGYTLDISCMRLEEAALVDNKTSLRFRAVTPSTSTEDGGDRVTDYFLDEIADVFDKDYPKVIKTLSVEGEENGELVLIEGLRHSIEQGKYGVYPGDQNNRTQELALTFEHDTHLPNGDSRYGSWTDKQLSMKRWRLARSVSKAVEDIVEDGGPLLKHLRQTRLRFPDTPIEIVLSGGGSKDATLRAEIDYRIEKDSNLQNVSLCTEDHNDQSLVSIGGIYLLVDPGIGDEDGDGATITKRSYGMVYIAEYDENNPVHRSRVAERRPMWQHASETGYRGKMELPDTVDWLTSMGSRVRKTSEKIRMSRQIFLARGEEPEPHRLIDISFEIVSTAVKSLGTKDGLNATNEGIDPTAELSFEMRIKDLAKCARERPEATYGFVQYLNDETGEVIPEWTLEFDCEVMYRWAGMLQIFEVRIPYGGFFPDDRELSESEMCILRFQIIGECGFLDDEHKGKEFEDDEADAMDLETS